MSDTTISAERMPSPSWNPAAGDTTELQRLKHQCARTFANHAQGRGLEAALNVLLNIANADGQNRRPKYNPRTRRMAATDYVRCALLAARLGDSGIDAVLAGGGIGTGMPEDGVAVIRIREVEAILASDDALRASIGTLRRAAAGSQPAGPPSGVRMEAEQG